MQGYPSLGWAASVSLPGSLHQSLGQSDKAFNVYAPAEVASAPLAVARQFFRQLRRFLDLENPFRECIGRKARKIKRCIGADFAVHWQIRRHHGQPACHRLDQRMSKRFGIRRRYVNMAGAIEVMK